MCVTMRAILLSIQAGFVFYSGTVQKMWEENSSNRCGFSIWQDFFQKLKNLVKSMEDFQIWDICHFWILNKINLVKWKEHIDLARFLFKVRQIENPPSIWRDFFIFCSKLRISAWISSKCKRRDLQGINQILNHQSLFFEGLHLSLAGGWLVALGKRSKLDLLDRFSERERDLWELTKTSTFSKYDRANFSMGIFRMSALGPGKGIRQVGQVMTSGWFLHDSHMTWPFRHWNIFTGGFMSSKQTEHSKSLSNKVISRLLTLSPPPVLRDPMDLAPPVLGLIIGEMATLLKVTGGCGGAWFMGTFAA